MKNFFKKIWSNRPFRTFLQGFIGVFFGSHLLELKDVNMLKTLVISAIMAGISAVMSLNTGEEKVYEQQTTTSEININDLIDEGSVENVIYNSDETTEQRK